MAPDEVLGPVGGAVPPPVGRRTVLRGGGALVTSLTLPTAAAAASDAELDLLQYSTYTVGFAQAATGAGTNPAFGVRLRPEEQAPSGVGTVPASGDVRLVTLDVLFAGGTGTKAITGTQVDLAVYPTTTRRTGAAIAADALGGVVARWSDAIAVAASGSDSWLRFSFASGPVLLDVGSEYYVGAIGPNGAFHDSMSVRTASQTSGAWTSAVDAGGTFYTYRVVLTGTFAY